MVLNSGVIKSKILSVLNREQYFFMYRGGAGGEFLSKLITDNSEKFRKFETIYTSGTNRTHIPLPKFYQCLTALKTKKKPLDILLDKIIETHRLFNFDIHASIEEAHEYLDTGLPPLIRIHYTFSEYFTKDNTWLLLQDDKKWFEYTSNLLYLKTGLNPVSTEEARSIFQYPLAEFPDKASKINLALEYIESHKINTLYAIQYEPLINDLDIPFTELFHTPPIDLIKKYGHLFDQPYDDFYKATMDGVGRRVNIIPYGKLFEKGYLEGVFDIKTDISSKVRLWHTKNLELLSGYDFDIDKYLNE